MSKTDLIVELEELAHRLHKALNGGLKFPGKPVRVSDHKEVERAVRNELLALVDRLNEDE